MMVSQETLDRLHAARKKKEKPEPKRLERSTKPMPFRSEKMRGIISALRPLYDKFLAAHPDCEIRTEVCTGQAECVHHTEGRGVKVILDDSKWKASCSACNGEVENKDAEAKANGNKVSRHKKNDKTAPLPQ